MRGVHGQGLHTKFRSWRMGIPWNTPFWWTNHPWRPCLLCNVPYHPGMRRLAICFWKDTRHPNVTWNLWLAMFIVCVACEFKGCTDHVPIVSTVSYSVVSDWPRFSPCAAAAVGQHPRRSTCRSCLKILPPLIPHCRYPPAEGHKFCSCWALGSTRLSGCQLSSTESKCQLWPEIPVIIISPFIECIIPFITSCN